MSTYLSQFQQHFLKFIRPTGQSIFSITDNTGAKLLTKRRVEFSNLHGQGFPIILTVLARFVVVGWMMKQMFIIFFAALFISLRNILLSNVSDILNSNVEILPDIHLTQILLYGSKVYNKIVNQLIIHETIRFSKSTGRFTILEAFPH